MLRAAATPIVYRELGDEGEAQTGACARPVLTGSAGLLWGGTYREPFDPAALRVSA
jgi:hypothetical protein